MCGIGLIVTGIRVNSSISVDEDGGSPIQPPTTTATAAVPELLVFNSDDLKVALQRRGPDRLGTKTVLLGRSSSENDDTLVSKIVAEDDEMHSERLCFDSVVDGENCVAEMHFIGAVLQLRGMDPVSQPMTDASGNVLVYNGEIFGGIEVSSESNDAEVLMKCMGDCCNCYSHKEGSICVGRQVSELLSALRGPWALIYWQNTSKTLWFGRDAFGRRSLLVHWPTSEDPRLLFSSVSPSEECGSVNLSYWEELPCGVYSMTLGNSDANAYLNAEFRKHEWTDSMLKGLINWERRFVEPNHEQLHSSSCPTPRVSCLSSIFRPAEIALAALRESVSRRSIHNSKFQEESVPIAVLFSGGLDSMILAAILHGCLGAKYGIDLLNVSFEGQLAPDRITARAGVEELKRVAPSRRWRLVEIDGDLSNLVVEMKHVMSLINPAKTYMDLNIGTALWLAARGHGWIFEVNGSCNYELYKRARYKSETRILLVGSGADEQCAGYGRHRTKYKSSSWFGLDEEMKLDMQRIWKRNLGRDDRCIADNGKEARFPFLDEDVIRVLLEFPLWEIADLNQPTGKGDKKILREVARLLGLHDAAALPKRAIQFGSRIAQESNKKNFGSNRAANMASAGSVEFLSSSK